MRRIIQKTLEKMKGTFQIPNRAIARKIKSGDVACLALNAAKGFVNSRFPRGTQRCEWVRKSAPSHIEVIKQKKKSFTKYKNLYN